MSLACAFADSNFGTEDAEAEEARTLYNLERRRRHDRQTVLETTSWEAVAGMAAATRRRQANLTQAAVPSALIAVRAEEAGEDAPLKRYVRTTLQMPTPAGVVDIVYRTLAGQEEKSFVHSRKLFKTARSEYLWGRCREALHTGKFEQMARELGIQRPTRELTFYELILPLLVVRRQSQYVGDDDSWSDDDDEESEDGEAGIEPRRSRRSQADSPPKRPVLRRAFFALDLPDEPPPITVTEARDRATRSAMHAMRCAQRRASPLRCLYKLTRAGATALPPAPSLRSKHPFDSYGACCCLAMCACVCMCVYVCVCSRRYHIADWGKDDDEALDVARRSVRRRGIQMGSYSSPMEA